MKGTGPYRKLRRLYTINQHCPTQCPRAFFCPPMAFRMPAVPFEKVLLIENAPFMSL